MSVIQRIRDKGAWIIFILIALALIAFILQDASFRRGNIFSNNSTVGKINGEEIDKTFFESQLDYYEQLSKQRNQPVSRGQLSNDVWNFLVEQTILKQEIKKLGLGFTSKELSDVLLGDRPPAWLQQAFTDPQTGMYNREQATQQILQMKKNSNDPRVQQVYQEYIQPTIDQTLFQKYQTLITQAVYVPKWMAEKINADNKSIAKISFVNIPYTTINDSSIKVTNDEILSYAKKHKKEYEIKEELRTIDYITFPITPTKEDTASVLSSLETLKSQFQSTKDEAAFVMANNSSIPFYNGYISGEEIKQPYKDSIFRLPVGNLYGPYLDGNSFVVAKLIDKKTIPDSVKIRHILVATHQQQQGGLMRVREDSAAQKILDSAIMQLNAGASWDSVAATYSDDPGSRNNGGVYDYFPSGRMVPEFNDFCFTQPQGKKGIVHTEYGFHYIEILSQKGNATGYKIAYIAKPIEPSMETINAAQEAANKFAAAATNKKAFDEAAAKLSKVPIHSPDIRKNDYSISPLDENRQMVRWIFEHKPGSVSQPFEAGNQYVVAVVTSLEKPGLPSVQKLRPQIENILMNKKKANLIIQTKIKGSTIEAIASNAQVPVQAADSLSFQTPFIPNVGGEPKIVGVAFNKQVQGKVSPAIAGNSGVFVVKGEGISAVPGFSGNTPVLQENMRAEVLRQIGNTLLSALHNASEIKDYRFNFY